MAMTMTTLEALLLLLSPLFSRLRYIVAMLHALVKLKLKRQLDRLSARPTTQTRFVLTKVGQSV